MPYRPVARDPRYVTLAQASVMIGGLLSQGAIRDLVRAGRVPGAVRAGRRYFVLRAHVDELVADVSTGVPRARTQDMPPMMQRVAPRPPRNTFDALAG